MEAPVDDDARDCEHEDDGEGGDGDEAHHVQEAAGGQQAADGGLGRAVPRVVAQLRQPGRGRGRRQREQGRGRHAQLLTIHPGGGGGGGVSLVVLLRQLLRGGDCDAHFVDISTL